MSSLQTLIPENNVIAGGAAALVTAVASHYQVQIGIPIPPETAAAVGIMVAHVWDVVTGETSDKGQAPPPPVK